MIEFKKLYSAANATEAYLIKGILEQNCIEVNLKGEGLSIGIGGLPADVIKVDIMINVDRFSEGLEIIHDYEKVLLEPMQEGEGWECKACNQFSPDNFEICWNCQGLHLIED